MPLGEVEGDRVDHYLPLTAIKDVLDATLDADSFGPQQRRPGALLGRGAKRAGGSA